MIPSSSPRLLLATTTPSSQTTKPLSGAPASTSRYGRSTTSPLVIMQPLRFRRRSSPVVMIDA
jgi:hypothetical protein